MFLRKLFNSENKLVWVLVDLIIVILGVYGAFLIQQYAAQEKTRKEKEEIISSLKYELEFFRVQMPGRAWYSNNQATKWRQMRNEGTYEDYSDWRFVEPQYNYSVVQYALEIQDTDIISFDLNNALYNVYRQVTRVENIERTMTQLAFRYQSIPADAPKGTIEYEIIWNKNYDDFKRLGWAMSDRSKDQALLAEESAKALTIVNNQLKPINKRRIEEDLIIAYVDELVKNEEEAVIAVPKVFPDFTEEEIRIMYQKATGNYDEGVANDSIPQ